MANLSLLTLSLRVVELEKLAEKDHEQIEELQAIILDPIEEKLDQVVRDRAPDGEAIAMYQGFGPSQGWNAYVPLAKEVMTKEMALHLAEDHNNGVFLEVIEDTNSHAESS